MAHNLTKEQVEEFGEAFALFARDNRDEIDARDLGSVMRALGTNPTEAELAKYVEEIGSKDADTPNKSSRTSRTVVSLSAFLSIMARQMNQSPATEAQLLESMAIFDKDDDGLIPAHELRHVLGTLGERLDEQDLDLMEAEFGDQNQMIDYRKFVHTLVTDADVGPDTTDPKDK